MNTIVSFFILVIVILLSSAMLYHQLDISKREFVITTTILLLFIGVTAYFIVEKFEFNNYSLAYIFTVYFLAVISINDIKETSIPMDILILGGIIGGVMLVINPNIRFFEQMIAITIIGLGGYAFYRVSKEGIGLGDVLVLIIICLLVGWQLTLTILIFSLVLAGIVGLFLLVFKRISRKTKIPFVPFILVATLFVFFA